MNTGTRFISLKSQELTSSGIPSLDAVLGGGLHVGSLILLNEDHLATYSDLFFKIFIAQGIVKKDDIIFASSDVQPKTFMQTLPQLGGSISSDATKLSNHEPLKIAWRYEHNPQMDQPKSFNSGFQFKGQLPDELINEAKIDCWPSEENAAAYESLLMYIREKLTENNHLHEQTPKDLNRNISRVCIHRLGSIFWEKSPDLLPYFLYRLRAIIHHSYAIAFITFPKHLIERLDIVSRCEHLSDSVIELESFGNNANPLYSEFDGFIKFTKLCTLNSLCPLMKDAKDWAFKYHHKRIIIEKLSLPPESASSEQREQDVTLSCSSQTNSKIDF